MTEVYAIGVARGKGLQKKLRAKLVESIHLELENAIKQGMFQKAAEGVGFNFNDAVVGDPWLLEWEVNIKTDLRERAINIGINAKAEGRTVEPPTN